MSGCEKCWAEASFKARLLGGSVADTYRDLLDIRNCTPEEQAGEDAGECPACHRKTVHQHSREPMCGCPSPTATPER